ncbi:conserved Plasmodium protein, unknown function [Plasmodium relictum]|uniref:Uncharacterized protein n=1 Tax=Plasmodium relictum TaxID=85471 RepID=A0A1J1H195_PLARL|nr:conserved Plasmodium protein, unknown function [Plasmodium relictum]CRG98690.1 conserved Plasmodium protein, unknown function [Plasmodium relictum]
MNFHKEIKKWVEQKKHLKKLKRGNYFFFKNKVKKSLFGNISNNNYVKEKVSNETNVKKCSFLSNKSINHLLYNDRNHCNNSSFYEDYHKRDYQETNIYYLKSIILNLNSIHYLFYKNDDIYLKLSQIFQEELRRLKLILNLEQEKKFIISNELYHKNKISINSCSLNLVDIINLFNFYIYIEKYYFYFFYIILSTIEKFQDLSNVNDTISINFLKSCLKLKKEINKNFDISEYKHYMRKRKKNNYTIFQNYFYLMKNNIFTKNNIHTLSHVAKDYQIFSFLNNSNKKRKYIHFICLKKKCYENINYSKFKKRKHKDLMIKCDYFIEKCIFLFLNKDMDISIFTKYIKILQNINIYNNNFISLIKNYLKKNYEYFTTEELIFVIKYLMKMKEPCKEYKISFGCIKTDIYKNINDYNIIDIDNIISIFSKNNYYDEKCLDIITNYIIENLNKVNSNTLVKIIINLYNLNYKNNELLYTMLNKYNPLIRNSRKKSNINNFFLKKTKLIYKKKKDMSVHQNKILKPSHDNTVCHNSNSINIKTKENISNSKYFRNFDDIKVKELLLFIKILIENNIYIDNKWSQYFFSLVKSKFLFIKKKDFYLLCFALLHLESREVFSNFFLLSSKYNIFKKYSMQKLFSLNDLSSIIQITLLFSFHIYRYNSDVFLLLFFYVLDQFYKSCKYEKKDKHQEDQQSFTKEEKLFNISYRDDKENMLQNNEENVYMHDLKIYERNKNNKYRKKKEKKKRDELKNKIMKITIPSCDQIKENISFQSLFQMEDKIQEVFQNGNLKYSQNEETNENKETINKNKHIKKNNGLLIDNIHIKKNKTLISNNSFTKNKQNIYRNEEYMNINFNNFTHYDNNIKNEKVELCNNENKYDGDIIINNNSSLLYCEDSLINNKKLIKENNSEFFFHTNYKNENSEKLLNYYTNDYFNKLRDSRHIIIIINNFYFNYIIRACKNSNKNNFFQNTNENYLLNKLRYKHLSLIYKTYELCSSYISMSLETIKIMNNNKNILSSKFHKQILSILRQLDSKNEIISEYVQYPFQIDICIKRKFV